MGRVGNEDVQMEGKERNAERQGLRARGGAAEH